MDSCKTLPEDGDSTLNSSSEEVSLETKIDITKKDIELMSEFGMSDLIPGFVEELTAYQSKYLSLTGRPYQRPSRGKSTGVRLGRNGSDFWQDISAVLTPLNLTSSDRMALAELCTSKAWIDMISPGLLMSYSYLYQCVRGIGSEDGPMIERDVLRTVGAVKVGSKVFQDTSELGKAGLARAMHRVLTAISVTDGMGYCQGMNYVVDFLLKVVPEDDAFCLFLYMLRCQHICTLYETKLPVLSDFMECFELQLAFHRPALASFLKECGFLAPFYSIEWFTTLFTLSCPPSLTFLIWDMFFFGIKDALLRCALALMIVLEEKLVLMSTESLLKDFRNVCVGVDVTSVVIEAFKIKLAPVKFAVNGKGKPFLERNLQNSNNPGQTQNRARALSGYDDGRKGERLLLQLRSHYLPEAQTAIQERDAEAERWGKLGDMEVKDKKRSISNGSCNNIEREPRVKPVSDTCVSPSADCLSTKDLEAQMKGLDLLREFGLVSEGINDNVHLEPSTRIISGADLACESSNQSKDSDLVTKSPTNSVGGEDFVIENNTASQTRADKFLASAKKRKSFAEISNEYLSDSRVYSKIAELRDIITRCDRLTHWLELNKRWLECLLLLRSDLQRYNIADHLLRFSISCGGHIRAIGFFLAVAGADPNAQDRWLCTPLHISAKYNRPDVVRLLLLCGADIGIEGALLWSIRHSTPGVVPVVAYTAEELVMNLSSGFGTQSLTIPSTLHVVRGKVCTICNFSPNFQASNGADGASSVKKADCCDIFMCQRCSESGAHWCVKTAFLERRQLASGLHEPQIYPLLPPSPSKKKTFRSTCKDAPSVLQRSRSVPCEKADDQDGHVDSLQEDVAPPCTHMKESSQLDIADTTQAGRPDRESFESEESRDSGFEEGQSESTETSANTMTSDKKEKKFFSKIRSFSFSTDINYARSRIIGKPKWDNELSAESRIKLSLSTQNVGCVDVAPPADVREASPLTRPTSHNLGPSRVQARTSSVRRHSDKVPKQPDVAKKSKRGSFKELLSRGKDSVLESVARKKGSKEKVNVPTVYPFKSSTTTNDSWLEKVGLQRLKWNGHDPHGNMESRKDCYSQGDDGSVPDYWVGYRGVEEWPLQSWQLYLLPRVVGPNPFLQLDLEHDSATADGSNNFFGEPKLAPPEHHPEDPEMLCFRNELSCFYRLINRDSMISFIQSRDMHGTRRSRSLDSSGGKVTSVAIDINGTYVSGAEINQSKDTDKETKKHSVDDDMSILGDLKLPPRNFGFEEQQKMIQQREIGRFFLSGKWTVVDGDPLWAPDARVWHCSSCFLVFTMFQRKHHCRRCGGLFCNDHAPLVDLLPHCIPDDLVPRLRRQVGSEAMDVKPVRLCNSCRYEMKHAPQLHEEMKLCQRRYSLSFWQNMTIMNRPLNSVIHNNRTNVDGLKSTNDIKGVTFAKFPMAGHWIDSMTGILWGNGNGKGIE